MRLLSCENATDLTPLVCPLSGPTTTSPVSASQTRIVWSDEPETMRLLSCENATELTPLVCPSSGPTTSSPVSASQTRIVWSDEPETMRLLSCENATELTQLVCPSSGPTTTSPVSASQTRIVWSLEPETMCLLSCENATELTSIGVSLERPYNNFSGLCIPDSDCLVIRARNNALAVLRECNRGDPVVCPSSGPTTTSPVSASQTRIVWSDPSQKRCACRPARMRQS
jgi:hypothetical protein